MQSGARMKARQDKKRNKPRNSFVPQDNSFNNEFLSHNSQVSQQPSSHISPSNSRVRQESPRIKRPSRGNENQSSKNGKSDKNRGRQNQKMEVIHQENLNIKANTPPKPKIKKTASQLYRQPSQQRQKSPKRSEHINDIPMPQPDILDEQSQQPVPEQKKMKDLNAGMEKLSQSILDLKSGYLQLEKQEEKHHVNHVKIQHKNKDTTVKEKIKQSFIFGEKPPEEYEREYKQFLKNQNKQKQVRKRVLQQIAEKDRMRIEQEKRQKEQQKQAQRKQRFNQIKQHNKFTEKHKRMKQNEAQRMKAIEQYKKKFEGKEYLARKKQKQDREKQKEMIQQQKRYLLQRKDMFKPIQFEQIDEHQKWYLDKIQQLANQKRQAKNEELKKIQEENAQLPQFFKGKAHNIALEERLEKVRKKKQPIQKIKRINQYRQYVRQNFVPRTYQNKSLQNSQIRNDSSLTHRQIKRYRYYKGISYGEVIQTRPIAKSSEEIKRMGIHNFEFMKKMPKKRANSIKLDAYEIKLMDQSRNRGKREDHFITQEDKKVKNTRIALPEKVKSDELSMIMRRIKANDQKIIHQQYALDTQPQVLNDYLNQRAINEQMVDNIQRKLSLLAQL